VGSVSSVFQTNLSLLSVSPVFQTNLLRCSP
jgi:hypothetical protein